MIVGLARRRASVVLLGVVVVSVDATPVDEAAARRLPESSKRIAG